MLCMLWDGTWWKSISSAHFLPVGLPRVHASDEDAIQHVSRARQNQSSATAQQQGLQIISPCKSQRDSLGPPNDSINKKLHALFGRSIAIGPLQAPFTCRGRKRIKFWASNASTRGNALQQLNSYLVSPFSMRSSPIMPLLTVHDSECMHHTRTSLYYECNMLQYAAHLQQARSWSLFM